MRTIFIVSYKKLKDNPLAQDSNELIASTHPNLLHAIINVQHT